MSLHTIKTNSTLNECQSNGIENHQVYDKIQKETSDSKDDTGVKSANNSKERKISNDYNSNTDETLNLTPINRSKISKSIY